MKRTVYVSAEADGRLLEYLRDTGADVVCVGPTDEVYGAINSHPDIRMCAVTDRRLIKARPGELGREYPECAAFCALCLDRYFIHNLKITDPRLLEAAKEAGKTPVDVRQGYARCSSAVVDGRSVITADPGIAAALRKLGDVDVLTVTEGHVLLTGFDHGFIGGASGRVGDELIFNGDLSAHPDHCAIEKFAAERGIRIRYFPEFPLTDIGSIIEIME